MKVNPAMPYMIGAGLVVAAVLYVAARGARQSGAGLGGAAVDMADGVLSGVVVGLGEKLGIDATNDEACEKALREGRTWDASFACPAKRFIGSFFKGAQ